MVHSISTIHQLHTPRQYYKTAVRGTAVSSSCIYCSCTTFSFQAPAGLCSQAPVTCAHLSHDVTPRTAANILLSPRCRVSHDHDWGGHTSGNVPRPRQTQTPFGPSTTQIPSPISELQLCAIRPQTLCERVHSQLAALSDAEGDRRLFCWEGAWGDRVKLGGCRLGEETRDAGTHQQPVVH